MKIKTPQELCSPALEEAISIRQNMLLDAGFHENFKQACELLLACRMAGGTIYTCGNGGSACDAIHLTEELVARYSKERPGIKSHNFLDSATLTCWCNDYGYETVFSRQVETFCSPKDVLVCFSTSGNSINILNALKAAKLTKTPSLLLSGKDGGQAKFGADVSIIVPSSRTDRIQEMHTTILHLLCEFLEQDL